MSLNYIGIQVDSIFNRCGIGFRLHREPADVIVIIVSLNVVIGFAENDQAEMPHALGERIISS